MTLPVHEITYPACLVGQSNGELDRAILVSTTGLAGGPTVWLVEPAARAWRALTAAALAAGHTLKATSLADSYRTLPQQTLTFRNRYQRSPVTPWGYRWWDSDDDGTKEKWYRKTQGTAPAAVPGTSNHGLGLAVDTGEERDGDTGTESIDQATLDWLVANELDFGFSHELQVERWHIRYWAGDAIPAAVLDYEASLKKEDEVAQGLVRFSDDPVPGRVWLADGMTKRVVQPEELVDNIDTQQVLLQQIISGQAAAVGSIVDIRNMWGIGGSLTNNNKVAQSSALLTKPNAFGVTIPFEGSGGLASHKHSLSASGSGSVTVSGETGDAIPTE